MLMRKILGLALLLMAAEAAAQSVDDEMIRLKQVAESCLASLQAQNCELTTACVEMQRYSKALMPDGPAGYYDKHIPDKSMNPKNGKLVSAAVTKEGEANKAMEKCALM